MAELRDRVRRAWRTHRMPPEKPAESRIVFIGGLHRSGTSPLARWLAEHRRVSNLEGTGVQQDEGQHLQDVYAPAHALGDPGRFGFVAGAHMTADDAPDPSAAERLWKAWAPYWNISRPVLIEKSPPNLMRLRYLQALFPDASGIVIVRHPVPVAYANARWSDASLDERIGHWVHCHELFLEDAPHVDRLTLVRYEDLVGDPETELARLWRFLGLEPGHSTPNVLTGINDKYFETWPEDRAGVDLAAHERVAAMFGYRLDEPLPRDPECDRVRSLLS